jgi:purine-binding chemotaxis protein CheW
MEQPVAEKLTASTFLEVRLGSWRCALPCALIEEVLPMLPVQRLPTAPPSLVGTCSIRHKVLPLLDPRPRLGQPAWVPSPHAHIVVIRARDLSLGLVVDSAEEVFSSPLSALCRPGLLEPNLKYGLGLLKREGGQVVVMDLEALVSDDEWTELKRAL